MGVIHINTTLPMLIDNHVLAYIEEKEFITRLATSVHVCYGCGDEPSMSGGLGSDCISNRNSIHD